MGIGLPTIRVAFEAKAVNAITRSARGIVACVLRDDTAPDEKMTVLKSVTEVDYTKWTEKNAAYLSLIYKGAPYRVLVIRVAQAAGDINGALKTLRDLKWNYLTIPGISESEKTVVSAWIKEQRENSLKTFKAVLPKCAADHEGVINLTTDNITVQEGEEQMTYTTAEYCARIAGLLAGLSLARSCTYYVLDDIVAADVPDDPDERINAGELVIVFDTEDYLIGRGVNSLVTITGKKSEDWQKIKIVEGMDLYQDDIRNTFKTLYVGKKINDYDNKQALVAAINAYNKELEGDVLDRSHDNEATISLDAQRKYLESKGVDTEEMTDLQIAEGNTGSQVFLEANVKFVDAMEDLLMPVYM